MINISRILYPLLSTQTGLVGNAIYPVVAPEEIKLPYMVTDRKGSATYTKDGLNYDDITVVFYIFTQDYDSGCDKANLVRTLLERKEIVSGNAVLYSGEVEGLEEDWTGDAYEQRLRMNFKLKR